MCCVTHFSCVHDQNAVTTKHWKITQVRHIVVVVPLIHIGCTTTKKDLIFHCLVTTHAARVGPVLSLMKIYLNRITFVVDPAFLVLGRARRSARVFLAGEDGGGGNLASLPLRFGPRRRRGRWWGRFSLGLGEALRTDCRRALELGQPAKFCRPINFRLANICVTYSLYCSCRSFPPEQEL